MDAFSSFLEKLLKIFAVFLLLVLISSQLSAFPRPFPAHKPVWGFWAHKRINRLAVFRLPVPMQVFYKRNIDFLTENATNPDKRRYAVVGEAERHYIDLDMYGDSAVVKLPRYWQAAILKLGEDSLRKHGIVPWQIQLSAYQLTEAFKSNNAAKILRVSADLGHYVADAHVPLHTTRNYNGQLSNQEGIHAFWESRLPELFADEYDLWNGPVAYVDRIAERAWQIVAESHASVDSVFLFEKELTEQFRNDGKYSYELRNNVLTRSYSREFSERYHRMLQGQVERRMKASIRMVGDLWYTCWINAGQPDLQLLVSSMPAEESSQEEQQSQEVQNVRQEGDN
ncbi:zinc dependent phospholipase C family protein [Dyadobacter crusticola]|uniref:zinc dependent phospholipase C family protein n=1 Tax=Dyadobacter crusticola TaxID=292407 RepID=UPI0005593D85|nr:zinc dependent phospholipase C family protein [Dyadobacter crusticola]